MKHFAVKVCGLTRAQDAEYAASLGVDMIGMIFHPKSPRYLSLTQAKAITKELPPTVDRVGVFVDQPIETIRKLTDTFNLQYVQSHRRLTEGEKRMLRLHRVKLIQVVPASSKSDMSKLHTISADVIMLDNLASDGQGGTGKQFDWTLRFPRSITNLMLAGGINRNNVEEGVRRFRPMIVDVNSGVESSPGVKSRKKLKEFMIRCNELRYGPT